jgi:cytochrome c oxidase assembly protein subunit 15
MTDKGAKSIIYIKRWLCVSAFMVFSMAIIGAITRLTESGLSMVEWRPLVGTIPPLSEAEWIRVFDLYRETPEYIKTNAGMSLDEFKNIFFWEWFHRVWGRMIGLVYAVPLIIFWVRGMIPQNLKLPLFGLLVLGGMQGVIGYIMVLSGFVDNPSVSHYRLSLHLTIAFIIFGCLMWLIYRLSPSITPQESTFCQRRHGWVALAFLTITVEWPNMGQGRIVPSDMWFLSPIWLNPFENAAAIQFTHRWIAVITLVLVATFAWRIRSFATGGMVFIQFVLGIATLLSMVAIPVAAMHQAGAFILCALLLKDIYRIRKIG